MKSKIWLGILFLGCGGGGGAEAPKCTEQDDPIAFCEELDTTDPTGDPCMTWQCDTTEEECMAKPRDEDRDGFIADECAPEDPARDCDDASEILLGMNAAELCDGIDNNCDGTVDEDAFETPVATGPLTGSLTSGDDPDHVAYAITPTTKSIVLVPGTSTPKLQVAFLDGQYSQGDMTDETNSQIVGVPDTGLAIAPLGGEHLVARINQAGDLIVGWVEEGTRFIEGTEADHEDSGIVALPPGCNAASSPALAAAGDERVLLAFTCRESIPNGCDSAAADVYITTVRFRNFATTISTADPLLVGETSDEAPIAIVGAEASFGWLLAYVNSESGAVEVHRVYLMDPTTGAVTMTSTPLFERAPESSEVLGGLAFSLGAQNLTEQTRQIALTYQTDCADGPTAINLFEVDFGDVTFEEAAEGTMGTGASESPLMLWDDRDGWLLAWLDGEDIRGQRLGAALETVGDAVTLFEAAGASELNHGLVGRGISNAEFPRYELFSYLSDVDEEVRGLWQFNVGCGLTTEDADE